MRWENTSLGRQLSGTCCGPGRLSLAAATTGAGVAITGVAITSAATVAAAVITSDAFAATIVAGESRPEASLGTWLTRDDGQVHY